MSSLYDRISKGTISVDEITASMKRSTSVGGKYFQSMEKQSKTVNGQLSTLKDNASQLLGTLSEGFSESLANNVLPMLNEMTVSLQEAFATGGIEAFSEKIGEVLSDLISKIAESLPKIVDMGANILKSLINGIQNNLPEIMSSIVKVVSTILETFLSLLPQILQMGITIIVELIKGIAQQAPALIPQIIDCIILMVETLIDNIDMIIDAGIQLILGLADGLIEALPRLIEKVPEIVEKLVEAFVRNFPKMSQTGWELINKLVLAILQSIPKCYEAAGKVFSAIWDGIKQLPSMMLQVGKNIVQGIWNGISGMASWLWSKIKGWCNNIYSNIKSFFGIHSPSTLFRDKIGKMLPQGLAVGIDADTDKALQAVKNMDNAIYEEMNKSVNYSRNGISISGINGTVNQMLSASARQDIVIQSNLELDGEKIYENQQKVSAKKNLQYAFA